MRRVSRNALRRDFGVVEDVTPRMRRVSRNLFPKMEPYIVEVTPRMRRVSRNFAVKCAARHHQGHASHEACE